MINNLDTSGSYLSVNILYVSIQSPLTLLYANIGKFRTFNVSSYGDSFNPGSCFVARFWIFSIISFFFSNVDSKLGLQILHVV